FETCWTLRGDPDRAVGDSRVVLVLHRDEGGAPGVRGETGALAFEGTLVLCIAGGLRSDLARGGVRQGLDGIHLLGQRLRQGRGVVRQVEHALLAFGTLSGVGLPPRSDGGLVVALDRDEGAVGYPVSD